MIGALARIEGRKLLLHPVSIAGEVFAVFGVSFFVLGTRDSARVDWDDDAWTVAVGVFFFALMVLIATNLASTRDRRDDTVEQMNTLPAHRGQRTGGLLVATLWALLPPALLLGATGVYAGTRTDLAATEWAQFGTALVLVLLFGTFGIALGVWLPSPILAPIAAWGLMVLTPDENLAGWRLLTTPLADFETTSLVVWHTAYLLGVTVLLAAAAIARGHRSRGLAALALAGTALTVFPAVVLVRSV